MFKTKRFLMLAVVALLSVMLLAACGTEDGKSDSGNSSDGEKTVLETIKERDKFVVGVKYDTKLFGLKDPASGDVEGFDIDIAKQIAKEILGDENKIELVEVTSKTRIPLIE